MRSMYRLLFIADVHVGDVFALSPTPTNRVQRYVGRVWKDIIGRLKWGVAQKGLDAVILVGDMVNGLSPKQLGLWVVQTELLGQVDMFMECWGEFTGAVGKPPLYILTGTAYHTGAQWEAERYLAKCMEAEGHEVVPAEDGSNVHTWLHLDCDGVRLDIAHHRSSVIAYQAMPLEREIYHNILRGGGDDVFIRAHAHRPLGLYLDNRWAIGLPPMVPFQIYTQASKTPNRFRSTQIGVLLMDIYPKEKKYGGANYLQVDWGMLYASPKVRYHRIRVGEEATDDGEA